MSGDLEPTAEPTGEDVTDLIKHQARALGFVEVGIAAYDLRYAYKSKQDWVEGLPHAVCLAYEQDFEPTQTIPSIDAEIVHSSTYRTQGAAALELHKYILSLGYRAQIHSANDNSGPFIPMFVAAGLGQLGACGYLLTPHEGSRIRIMMITTDANVRYDEPVDYGIHAFCQVCQVCVNRCPGRALMRDKIWWRGMEKNKLYFRRCRPIMARYLGCGICMKVCPIQKYGMKNVMEHYAETGQVLGKGTHDLEGYTIEDKGYFRPRRVAGLRPWLLRYAPGRHRAVGLREPEEEGRRRRWRNHRRHDGGIPHCRQPRPVPKPGQPGDDGGPGLHLAALPASTPKGAPSQPNRREKQAPSLNHGAFSFLRPQRPVRPEGNRRANAPPTRYRLPALPASQPVIPAHEPESRVVMHQRRVRSLRPRALEAPFSPGWGQRN